MGKKWHDGRDGDNLNWNQGSRPVYWEERKGKDEKAVGVISNNIMVSELVGVMFSKTCTTSHTRIITPWYSFLITPQKKNGGLEVEIPRHLHIIDHTYT